jgi:hypothetical protein
MVQSDLVERFDAVVPLMTTDDARACVNAINGHMNSARALLLDLYERRGWAALGYQNWRECVSAEFQDSQRHLYRQLEAAEIERRIDPMGQIGAHPERQIRPLAALTPIEQPIAWQEANERTNGKPTARVVEEVVKEMREDWQPDNQNVFTDPKAEQAEAIRENRKVRTNAGLFTSNTPEWYTPGHIIDRVEGMFGHIDLDPCSNSNDPDQASVPALNHWTQADNGLVQSWHGRVYMNPPYGDEISAWVERMIRAYESEEINCAIALLPARTDTAWFQPLFDYPICFIRGRLRFSGSENSAPFPSAIVYLGVDTELFFEFFQEVGRIK